MLRRGVREYLPRVVSGFFGSVGLSSPYCVLLNLELSTQCLTLVFMTTGEAIITGLLGIIIYKLFKMATKQEQFDAALAKIDAATSDIADDLRRLKEEIANGDVSQESLDRLTANADTLDALGKSTPEPDEPTE